MSSWKGTITGFDPTAEVPLPTSFAIEVLDPPSSNPLLRSHILLPQRGRSYGRDVARRIRQHQFQKWNS